MTGLQESVAAKGQDGLPAALAQAVTITAGTFEVAVVRAWTLPQVQAATVRWPSTAGGHAQVDLQLLAWPGLGDQAARLQWELAATPMGPAVWPPASALQLSEPLPVDDAAAAGKQPVWSKAVPMAPLAAAGLGPDKLGIVRVRLVYGDSKAGLPGENARGPWVTALAQKPASAGADATETVDAANTPDVIDAAVGHDTTALADSKALLSPTPRGSDGACGAERQPVSAWVFALGMVVGLVRWRRR